MTKAQYKLLMRMLILMARIMLYGDPAGSNTGRVADIETELHEVW